MPWNYSTKAVLQGLKQSRPSRSCRLPQPYPDSWQKRGRRQFLNITFGWMDDLHIFQARGWQTFSVKGQWVNVLDVRATRSLSQLPSAVIVGQKQPQSILHKWVWLGSNKTLLRDTKVGIFNNYPMSQNVVSLFLEGFIYLTLERGKEREREREKNIRNIYRLPLTHSRPGTKPTAQARALTRNWTSDLSLCGTMPNPLSHTGHGYSLESVFLQPFKGVKLPLAWGLRPHSNRQQAGFGPHAMVCWPWFADHSLLQRIFYKQWFL